MDTYLDQLHATLDGRFSSEAVAKIISQRHHAGDLDGRDPSNRRLIQLVDEARREQWHYGSSMSQDFERADPATVQLAAVQRMFPDYGGAWPQPDDAEALLSLVNRLGILCGGWTTDSDWLADRRHAYELRRLGIPRRQYNRKIRALRNLTEKAEAILPVMRMRRLVLTGRSGFASQITLERFRKDPDAACFIAYWVARKNRRRGFSLSGRENPMDQLADALLTRCLRGYHTDFGMIAMAYPAPEVLDRVNQEQIGLLTGQWWGVMRECAAQMELAYPPELNRVTMVVRRGYDSSTWNTLASAYNAARAAWISCLEASGALSFLDVTCPGKAMRMMAADLFYWHKSDSGSEADINAYLWAELPLPWEVIDGRVSCTRESVAAICRRYHVDPDNSGWTGTRAKGEVAAITMTPELVHGVTIASPEWAAILRKAGAFSGKEWRNPLAGAMLPEGQIVSKLPYRDAAGNVAANRVDSGVDVG